MRKSKRVFLVLAVLFFLAMMGIGYDISRRTTFPGSDKLLPDALSSSDSVDMDTVVIKKALKPLEDETK
jgi:hypothetical protein